MQKLIEDRNLLLSALKITIENYISRLTSDIENVNNIYSMIKKDENNHFLSLSQDDLEKISYARTPDDIYNSSKRVKTTFERYVRRQLNIDCSSLSDTTLNYLGRQFRIKITPLDVLDSKVRLLSGKDISNFYQETSITSCMCNHNAFKTEMYSLNPDVIQLIVFDESSRALLWTSTCGTKIVDRIYPENCETSSMLRGWIEKNQYIYRVPKGCCDENYVELSDGKTYSFDLKHDNVFPYLDTFCFGSVNYKKVTLTNKHFTECFTFHSTDGEYLDNNTCSCCYGPIYNGDEYSHDGCVYCRSCYEDRFFTCYTCEETYIIDNLHEGFRNRSYCGCCFHKKYFNCESCEELELISNSIPTVDGCYCKDCFDKFFFKCESCGESIEIEEKLSHDNLSFCKECFEKHHTICSNCNDAELITSSKIENNIVICEICQ